MYDVHKAQKPKASAMEMKIERVRGARCTGLTRRPRAAGQGESRRDSLISLRRVKLKTPGKRAPPPVRMGFDRVSRGGARAREIMSWTLLTRAARPFIPLWVTTPSASDRHTCMRVRVSGKTSGGAR